MARLLHAAEQPALPTGVSLPAYATNAPFPKHDTTVPAIAAQPSYEEALLEQDLALITSSGTDAISSDAGFVTLYADQKPWGLRLARSG